MARVTVDVHKCGDCDGLLNVKIGDKFEMVLSVEEAVALMQGLGSQLGVPAGSNGKAKHTKGEVSNVRGHGL